MPTAEDAKLDWMRDESLRSLADRLGPETIHPRLVSFDFFDTLWFRLCAEPSDLFVETGRQLAARGLLRAPLAPAGFRAARIAADERVRAARVAAGKIPEVTLDDIYAGLGDVVTDPAAAREVEFAVERGLGFVNPAMVSLVERVRALGCRTAIASDTYLTAAELCRMLEEQGVPASLFDDVLVSCELGQAKWLHGTLYHELLRRFEVAPGEVLHVGDNAEVDVAQARRLGLDSHLYRRVTAPLAAALSGERRSAAQALRAGALDSVRLLAARGAEDDRDAFRDGAFVLGPVLARFADWCVDVYARAGVRRVLALMREGELLGELVARSAAARGVPLEVEVCHASRMATARAALPQLDAAGARGLLEGAAHLTPQGILEILGLGAEGAEFMDEARRTTPLPGSEAAFQFLAAVFGLPRIRELAEARHRESRELAFEYLASRVGDDATVGVLDLGWSGSIQRNIARILRQGGRGIRTVGCYLACTRRSGRLALEGQEAHAYFEAEWDRNAILVEVCTTACTGSTRGYERDDAGAVRPALEPDPHSPAQRAAKQRIREGVLAFQRLWLTLLRREAERGWSRELLADLDRFSPAILFRWMDYPTKSEADRLALLHHDENYFGSNNSALACDEVARARLRRDGVQALFRGPGCFWPQGVLAQVYPRLATVLRERWADPVGMGRLGAYGSPGLADAALTADELAALGALLTGLAPDQIVFCGPAAPEIVALAQRTPQHPDTAVPYAQRRLVVAGPVVTGPAVGEADDSRVAVRGELGDARTLLGIRAALHPGASVSLVLTDDVPAASVPALLRGLAPFLGPRGAVLLACGRYDRLSAPTEHPFGPFVAEWLAGGGSEIGFRRWTGQGRHEAELSNWIVLVHAPDRVVYDSQWLPGAGATPGGAPEPFPRERRPGPATARAAA